MGLKKLLFVAVLSCVAFYASAATTSSPISGAAVSGEPIQKILVGATPFEVNGYRLIPLAEFSVEARVLSTMHYSTGREADLVPVDLALGWGRMSEDTILKDIDISQSGRFFFWKTKGFPLPRAEIESESTNMHLIPANTDIENALKAVQLGQIITFSGYLVEVTASDGWHWRSSLSRTDTGPGACELVYVKSFSVRDTTSKALYVHTDR